MDLRSFSLYFHKRCGYQLIPFLRVAEGSRLIMYLQFPFPHPAVACLKPQQATSIAGVFGFRFTRIL
jgi:hypothetical protein